MLIPQNSDDVMMIIETGVNNANWSSKRSCRETIRKRKMAVNFRQICFRITQKKSLGDISHFFDALPYLHFRNFVHKYSAKKGIFLVAWTL